MMVGKPMSQYGSLRRTLAMDSWVYQTTSKGVRFVLFAFDVGGEEGLDRARNIASELCEQITGRRGGCGRRHS